MLGGGRREEVLRVTKVQFEGNGASWSFSVVSSNRVDEGFVRQLKPDRVCWAVNPLVKNYQEVAATL